MSLGFAMPHSEMAEVAVIGAMITNPSSLKLFLERDIQKDMFFLPRNKKLVELILKAHDVHGFAEPQVLMESVTSDKQIEIVVGGIDYLMKVIENASGKSSVDHYLDIIEEKYQLRNLIEVSQDIIEGAKTLDSSADDFLFESEQRVVDVTRNNKDSTMQSSVEIVNESMDNLLKAMENDGNVTGLETGFVDLDYVTNGLQKGDLIILGARPSVGKTAFALNLALNVAQMNKEGNAKVAMFSLEMPSTHLMNRLISTVSTIPNQKIRSGDINKDEYNKISAGANQIQQTNIYVDDNSGTTMAHIFKQCRSLNADDDLDMIVIDYIQLIESIHTKGENRQQEVSKISRQLKKLAGELKVPVIALSQLSRGLEQREDKRPRLSDLRESGSLEQDSDLVMFLHRDDYQVDGDEEGSMSMNNTSQTLLRISKNRNGSLRDIDMMFEKDTGKFYSQAKEY